MPARFIDAGAAGLRLECPCCHQADLAYGGDVAKCSSPQCGREFTCLRGVPLLLNPQRSLFRAEDFIDRPTTTFKATGSVAERIGRRLPSPSRDVGRQRNYSRLAQELQNNAAERRRVLVIGCGDGSAGYLDLEQVDQSEILETDVSLAGRAKIICDASDLPFADGSFDMVVCQAVLEHVVEPQRCVDEIYRVLRHGGIAYATTPFMQQVHMGEFDFMRFTRSGHRWLFRMFEEVDSGIATGPASVLVWSVEYFLLAWTDRLWLRRVLKACVRIAFGWITVLDEILAHRTAALDAAGGFFFIGRRAGSSTLRARDLIQYYRGADSEK